MRDEGVIYVAGHPLLNRRCTRLPGCIRLRNDLYCVEWGVKLYSLTSEAEYADKTLRVYRMTIYVGKILLQNSKRLLRKLQKKS